MITFSEKNNQEDITIIIVTFKSDKIIRKCLDNLDQNIKKILVENSDNYNLTSSLKNEYKNLVCINIGYDAGFGFALNRGIEASKTRYIVSINPDTFPEEDCLKKIYSTIIHSKDTVMVTPITIRKGVKEFKDYGYFDSEKIRENKYNELVSVDWVNGNILILDTIILNQIGKFDENIFLQWEERDFQKRIYDANKKILINFRARSHHLEGQSHDPIFNYAMKCESSWHHGWSKFYFFKKHYGFLTALNKTYKDMFIYFCKFMIWGLLFNWRKSNIYRMFFLGIICSIFNTKSFYRAKIN